MRSSKNIFIKVVSSFIIIGALWIAFVSVKDYFLQKQKADWPEAEAVITEVAPRQSANDSSKILYDISYIFDVGMDTYSGVLKGETKYRDTGDTFTVKYDPDDPWQSTDNLSADGNSLSITFVFSFLMINTALLINKLPNVFAGIYRLFGLRERNIPSETDPEEITRRIERYTNDHYPLKLSVIAVFDSLKFDDLGVPFWVGATFFAFGFFLWFFFIPGILCLLFYLFKGPVSTLRIIKNCYDTLGNIEFYRTVEATLTEKKYPHRTYFRKVMSVLCEKAHI